MPTFDREDLFLDDYESLTPEQRRAFKRTVAKFIEDLRRGQFRKGLRIKRVRGLVGVWEMTWAEDGRATFTYGPSIRDGEPHIRWRRIGTHDIFEKP